MALTEHGLETVDQRQRHHAVVVKASRGAGATVGPAGNFAVGMQPVVGSEMEGVVDENRTAANSP